MNVAATMRYVLIGVGLWSGTAAAELTIIYDSGRTQSLAPYLAAFAEDPPAESAAATPEIPLGAADLSQLLPIRTPELTPGAVTARPLSLPDGVALPRPFFLIGADPRSLEWLARHRERLAEIMPSGCWCRRRRPMTLKPSRQSRRVCPYCRHRQLTLHSLWDSGTSPS